ncbi:MAG: SpoIIE family protein phosphatase, partial [Planctomycetota bacterium]
MGWFGRGKDERRSGRDAGRSFVNPLAAPDQTQVLTGDDRIDGPKVRILLDAVADLISTVNHRAVLTSIVDKSIRVVGAERGILFLFEKGDPERLSVQVARDAEGRDLREPIQYSTTVTRKVAMEGSAMCWKVSSQEQAVDLSQSIVDMKLRAVMCVTLRVKDRRLGVIYVDSRASHREFSRADLRFFDALAGALSIAVENARLIRETVASERVKEQVKVAHTIQEGLLPKNPVGIKGFELAGWAIPAEEALGDYYDFIPLDDGRWVVAIGDVAGHGIGPALLMSSARSLLRSLTDGPFEVPEILARMNNRFEEDTGGSMFMSMFVAVFDPSQRSFVYGNAGHTSPLLVRQQGSEDLNRTGLALGIEQGMTYEVKGPVVLMPGDTLVLTTDGILESRRGEEFFGRERLESVV